MLLLVVLQLRAFDGMYVFVCPPLVSGGDRRVDLGGVVASVRDVLFAVISFS